MLKSNTVIVKIGEKEYEMSLNFGVLKMLQKEKKDLKIDDVFKGIQNQDYNLVSQLVCQGIKWNHKEFEMSQLNDLSLVEMLDVFRATEEVVELSLTVTNKENEVQSQQGE